MIRKKQEKNEIVIDLTGPNGNAYVLLGYAKSLGNQLGLPRPEIDKILESMMSSDYDNLIKVFDQNFGNFVILEK